jgi:hypothetical protein
MIHVRLSLLRTHLQKEIEALAVGMKISRCLNRKEKAADDAASIVCGCTRRNILTYCPIAWIIEWILIAILIALTVINDSQLDRRSEIVQSCMDIMEHNISTIDTLNDECYSYSPDATAGQVGKFLRDPAGERNASISSTECIGCLNGRSTLAACMRAARLLFSFHPRIFKMIHAQVISCDCYNLGALYRDIRTQCDVGAPIFQFTFPPMFILFLASVVSIVTVDYACRRRANSVTLCDEEQRNTQPDP